MMRTMKFDELESKVLRWASARGILENGSAIAQLTKTEEEVAELREALENDDREKVIDGYADVLITLIIGSEIYGVDIIECLEAGYEEIKNRTGFLNEEGIFVRDK